MKTAYGISTAKVIQQYEYTENPVTKSVLREIIGNRIDSQELFKLSAIEKFKKIDKALAILTPC